MGYVAGMAGKKKVNRPVTLSDVVVWEILVFVVVEYSDANTALEGDVLPQIGVSTSRWSTMLSPKIVARRIGTALVAE